MTWEVPATTSDNSHLTETESRLVRLCEADPALRAAVCELLEIIGELREVAQLAATSLEGINDTWPSWMLVLRMRAIAAFEHSS